VWRLPSADWPLESDPDTHSFTVLVEAEVAGFASGRRDATVQP